ncbi:AAA family ATPase [Mucilaginibacter angelicae]|uniref:AAA family ATPase n=1 Tax=Mucilaginibacter angelicae TaxID=869718 RepID=A0ABV6LAC5_9SPHI
MPQQNKKQFAAEFWRYFELLTLMLFEIDFKLERSEILMTKMTRDGGRDVEINKKLISNILPLPNVDVWVEAKLRDKRKQVMIKDIAGSVIMASNANIRSLYFVTNCYFTKQTVEELLLFAYKSGLKINLVDGYHYRNLLTTHYEEVLHRFQQHQQEMTLDSFSLFMKELLENLPQKSDQTYDQISVTIGRENLRRVEDFTASFWDKDQIDLRRIRSTAHGKTFRIALNEIQTNPVLSDNEIANDVRYQLIGARRKVLLQDVARFLQDGQIVIIKGESGKGKSFFANHLFRQMHKLDYNVASVDLSDINVLTFSKEIIGHLIGLNYFALLESDEGIIDYLSSYFQLPTVVCKQMLEVIRQDRFTAHVAPEICLEVLIKMVQSHQSRKKVILMLDNLHKVSSDMMAFLKALFNRLREINTPVIALTVSTPLKTDPYYETQWIRFIDSLSQSNRYQIIELPELEDRDIDEYIFGRLPGVNLNMLSLIKRSTLNHVFYVELYIELLKSRSVIRSVDEQYWWLGDPAALLDSRELQSGRINNLITAAMQLWITDSQVRDFVLLLFFSNNILSKQEALSVYPELNLKKLLETNLFKAVAKEDNLLLISFHHDLFYANVQQLFTQQVLAFEAAMYLEKMHGFNKPDVLGKLYEYAGDYERAARQYRLHAECQISNAPFNALIFYEKAIDISYRVAGAGPETENIVEMIFPLLKLYDRFNFLASRRSPELFGLLKKFADFRELGRANHLQYLYFLGVKFTKEEDFHQAADYLTSAYELAVNEPETPQEMLFKILCSKGINLKHLGEKDASITFFEQAAQRWESRQLRNEQYSNLAAYYLTSQPTQSLYYYEKIKDSYTRHINLHLLIDMAMANFYLHRFDETERLLLEAIPLSKKRLNLAEEARAQNIYGIINWRKGDFEMAEAYLDLAQSNSELANNHRWLWRIKTNLAQLAFQKNLLSKSYNICTAVSEHLLRTRATIAYEVKNLQFSSRRYAALKAVAYTLFRLEKTDDLRALSQSIAIPEFDKFTELMMNEGSVDFDHQDSNKVMDAYCILG